jgi:predicted dehydrogenase
VDLVILAVSDRFHVPLATEAVRAGKHVLVEKPLGVNTRECENLRLLVSPDRVFAIGCNRRFLPGVRAAKAFASRSQSIASYSASITIQLFVTESPNRTYFLWKCATAVGLRRIQDGKQQIGKGIIF